nr:hypothetical protein [Chamaesiphon sp. OTE_20_metabat_361]
MIDTGFDGFLSLPSEIIVRLGLPWTISNSATLGDGSEVLFDFYTGTTIWDGQYRTISWQCIDVLSFHVSNPQEQQGVSDTVKDVTKEHISVYLHGESFLFDKY